MLAEYLSTAGPTVKAAWHMVMPGVQVCRFSVDQPAGIPIELPVQLEPLHFEILFCSSGTLLLGRKRGSPLTVSSHEILLFSNSCSLRSARIAAPLSGILVSVDGKNVHDSFHALSHLVGDLKVYGSQVNQLMADRGGCALLPGSTWSRSVFSTVEGLPPSEQGRYCVLKTVELLYLLCTRSSLLQLKADPDRPDSYLTRTVADMQNYMETHLDEKLTIELLSRRFHISPTAFKSCFRRLYGQPVHTWLLAQRMKRAAEFLHSSPMTILQIAQAVGYEGVSQFNVAFKRRYGIAPSQYRKMSNTGDI